MCDSICDAVWGKDFYFFYMLFIGLQKCDNIELVLTSGMFLKHVKRESCCWRESRDYCTSFLVKNEYQVSGIEQDNQAEVIDFV